MTELSPTPRTTLTREKERGVSDRAELMALLREGLIAHLGVTVGDGADAHPVVLPVAYAVEPDGPDRDGTLYVHGSVAAGWLRRTPGASVCVTVTALDGLVLARSAFNHSMNYRCGVVIGPVRLVDDPEEKAHALDLIVEHVVPGRAAALRPNTRKELAATAVLAVPLHEASLKTRAGGPEDDQPDIDAGYWAGHLPLRVVASPVVPDPAAPGPVPEHVQRRAADFA
ncbi:pyridoxamine 5'-phosphate oxidase family protein [Nocardioides sp.]|uniref:pyridoxamine 5'-phosphate oxidase family protein n=1 Tax=Nocardioides sp. TaxID=35761 RepID=UPI0025CFA0AE|nr:pyridoxamine 5'-phosphate oxidase family protein [Nocardioides sp.]